MKPNSHLSWAMIAITIGVMHGATALKLPDDRAVIGLLVHLPILYCAVWIAGKHLHRYIESLRGDKP